ncbi:MAG: hypothetical protein NC204_07440 [Candidatus Amulumruptor caecigallinarius]|nr:hypothetical protein [Candidatus Amulumruptor caecigallinarius]
MNRRKAKASVWMPICLIIYLLVMMAIYAPRLIASGETTRLIIVASTEIVIIILLTIFLRKREKQKEEKEKSE